MKTLHIKKTISAFILVETIVATGIILLALPAMLSISSRAMNMSSLQKSEMVATYLAEEGIEMIRAMRDENNFRVKKNNPAGVQWNEYIWQGTDNCRNRGCTVDPIVAWNLAVNEAPGGTNDVDQMNQPLDAFWRLSIDANGFYRPGGAGTPTPFYRQVRVGNAVGNAYDVTSLVAWETPSGRKLVILNDRITNWIP